MPRFLSGLALLGLATVGACGFRAYSPPAGWSPAENVAPLKPEQSSIAGAFHLGGGIFGPGVVGGSVSIRHGLTDTYEVQGDVAYAHIREVSRSSVFKGIISARAGLKGLFSPKFEHISWNASLGGGGHAGGGFIAPEVGVQFGYENPYLIPWLRTSVFLSHPLGPKTVDIAPPDKQGPDLDTPQTTFGIRIAMGFSIAWAEALPMRIHFVNEMIHLNRVDGKTDGIFGFGLAVETLF